MLPFWEAYSRAYDTHMEWVAFRKEGFCILKKWGLLLLDSEMVFRKRKMIVSCADVLQDGLWLKSFPQSMRKLHAEKKDMHKKS